MPEVLIYCPINLFTIDQKIYLVKDNYPGRLLYSTLAELPKAISDLAEAENVTKVVLDGVKSANEPIADKITEYCVKNYKKVNFKIEVK